jgi:hypothetical protein
MRINDLPPELVQKIHRGVVIPAHPLALNKKRLLDEKHQKAITRYYIDAGVGGIAVGVHTTQFEIRDPQVGLFKPVLALASQTADEYRTKNKLPAIFKIAGVCGKTRQAVKEAGSALDMGYHAVLLSLAAFKKEDVRTILAHCREIASIMPVVGFYLQPVVGGRVLPYEFWRKFAEIENVISIKIAPFNRYQTLDVVKAVCDAGREKDIALYTGNDDNIVIDLLTQYKIPNKVGEKTVRIVGGLLGHWAFWTRRAVELLNDIHQLIGSAQPVPPRMLTLAAQITDVNAAIFNAANNFASCIAGVHEVLHRQGLMTGTWCINPKETLFQNHKKQIDEICAVYPQFNDDDFVKQNLQKWLSD